MKRVALAVMLLMGCDGTADLTDSTPFGPEGTQLECYGDPDMGSVICKPRQELWDCSAMPNGSWKCAKKSFAPPDGTGGWTCTGDGTRVTCTKPGADVPGAGGWTCTNDGKTTTCVYDLPSAPPGGGTWTCSVVEFALVCVGQPASGGGTPPPSSGTPPSSGGTPPPSSGTPPSSGGTPPPTGGTPPSSGGSSGFGCSYAMIVFSYGGKTYVMKIGQDLTCTGDATTSKDANFSTTCNGQTYDNSASFTVERGGAPVAPYPGPPACSSLFTITKQGATAAAGVTILFGVAHNGSFPNHFATLCPPAGGASSIAFPPICGS
jgi:hypothetical protein